MSSRPEGATTPARIAPLARLPVFLALAGKDVVLAGGGSAAVWKAELLSAAGANLRIYAEQPSAAMEAFVAERVSATLVRRAWREGDLDGAVLAVAEEAKNERALAFAAAARRRHIPVNVIDQPGASDFYFGSIVNRSPVVVAISTGGAAPMLAQAIRRRIEAILPTSLGAWSLAAKAFRARLADILPSPTERRAFWERFVARSLEDGRDGLGPATLEALAAQTGAKLRDVAGQVTIVGAGPGDPELLTLRAMRELQAADVVLYDRLVTPEVLELARREAQRVEVGKKGHGASCRQEDINAMLVDLARRGKRVVRLKGGDPAIFARTGEEVAACRRAGVRVNVVPGITTASAAAAALNLSLTHRQFAHRVQFVTGHDRHGALPTDLDLHSLSDPRATTVIYMGRQTAAPLAANLLKRGVSPTTPALVLTNVSRPDQRTLVSTLRGLAQGDARANDEAPTLVLFGAALSEGLADAASRERAGPPAYRRSVSPPHIPILTEPEMGQRQCARI